MEFLSSLKTFAGRCVSSPLKLRPFPVISTVTDRGKSPLRKCTHENDFFDIFSGLINDYEILKKKEPKHSSKYIRFRLFS